MIEIRCDRADLAASKCAFFQLFLARHSASRDSEKRLNFELNRDSPFQSINHEKFIA